MNKSIYVLLRNGIIIQFCINVRRKDRDSLEINQQ